MPLNSVVASNSLQFLAHHHRACGGEKHFLLMKFAGKSQPGQKKKNQRFKL
jgi:hypothetical protein